MAGRDPAIHVFLDADAKNVDARHKAGHDETVVRQQQHQNFSFLNTASGSALMTNITRRHLPLT
jgi:hypothetical protein